jgi:hypothetical protein
MDATRLAYGAVLAILAHGCAGPGRPGDRGFTTRNNQPQAESAAFVGTTQTAPDLRIPSAPAPVARGRSEVVQLTGSQDGPALSQANTEDPSRQLRQVHRQAAERYAAVDSYIARLKRREQINGRDKPEEILLFKFRKEPFSVYFKWLGEEAHGREVVFVNGHYEGKIHTLLAAGDVPLMPAGRRMALLPDNPLVRASSRHSITEAGVGNLIDRFGVLVERAERASGRQTTLAYLGPINRPEMERGGEGVAQTILPGAEAQLPHGGKRLWVFDAQTKFPTLLVTQDETGHEVEYYCYDRFEFPVRLDDDDFNPDRLWTRRANPPSARQTANPTYPSTGPVGQPVLPH